MTNGRNVMMMMTVIVLIGLHGVHGTVTLYKRTKLIPHNIDYQRAGMFNSEDTPAVQAPGNGQTFISFDVQFSRQQTSNEGYIDVAVFHSDAKPHIGIPDGDKVHYCCTQKLFDANKCSNLHHLIVKESVKEQGPVIRYDRLFLNTSVASIPYKFSQTILKSGMYYLFLASCYTGTTDVSIDGRGVWMNPFGHLPGEFWGFVPFFGLMALVYIAVAVIWFVFCAMYWKDILKVQVYLTGILAISMIEMLTKYAEFSVYNDTGTHPVAAFVLGVLFSVTKRALSRMMVLAVSMGYGVVKPTLGTDGRKVLSISAFYFLFSFCFEMVNTFDPNISKQVRFILAFPVSLLDSIIYWWIFFALTTTIRQLKQRNQTIKLKMYRYLALILIASAVASICIASYQVMIEYRHMHDKDWKSLWLVEAYWYFANFCVILGICILWRPAKNNARYGYSEVGQRVRADSDEEDEEEGHGGASLSDVRLRPLSTRVVSSDVTPTTPKESQSSEVRDIEDDEDNNGKLQGEFDPFADPQ